MESSTGFASEHIVKCKRCYRTVKVYLIHLFKDQHKMFLKYCKDCLINHVNSRNNIMYDKLTGIYGTEYNEHL